VDDLATTLWVALSTELAASHESGGGCGGCGGCQVKLHGTSQQGCQDSTSLGETVMELHSVGVLMADMKFHP